MRKGEARQATGEANISRRETWFRYTVFREWALANGYREGLTIDRISSDGNYEPSNCQWITQSENARKCRNTVWWVEIFGETKTIGQWLKDDRCVATKESSVRMRLRRGWSPERAISTVTNSPNRARKS